MLVIYIKKINFILDTRMELLLIIIILVIIWYFTYYTNTAGFENNNFYFQGNENDTMYVGNLIQPRLIHKINIPPEW